MKLSSNTLMLIAATILLMAGAYWFFFSGSGNEPPLSANGGGAPAAAQFESLAGELSPISFDTDLFGDPRFASLVDLATPVAPESSGRLDPFAPI